VTTPRRLPRNRAEMLRDEMVMRDRIAALLSGGARTIPDLSQGLDRPSPEVVCWVMAMRRYGMVQERGKADADGHFSYGLTDKGRSTFGVGESGTA
jgi:hypothetical protein